ncbi:MAG: hypothetical protein ACPG77_04990 [Nannocystaceae bacterium]
MARTALLPLLLAACTFSAGTVPKEQPEVPAAEATPDEAPATPSPEQNDSGTFAKPPGADAPAPANPQPSSNPELDRKVKDKFGQQCRFDRECEGLVGVDCNSAADGPYYYAERDSLETVATCGGACMAGGCKDTCPPKAWTCPAY